MLFSKCMVCIFQTHCNIVDVAHYTCYTYQKLVPIFECHHLSPKLRNGTILLIYFITKEVRSQQLDLYSCQKPLLGGNPLGYGLNVLSGITTPPSTTPMVIPSF
jgi:hypothetical protein